MSSPSEAVIPQWLDQLSRLISGMESAVVLLKEPAGEGKPRLVLWPDQGQPSDNLTALAQKASETRRQLILPANSPNRQVDDLIALPLIVRGEPEGAVALSLSARSAQKQKAALQALQWSLRWLQLLREQADHNQPSDTAWFEQMVTAAQSPTRLVKRFAEAFQCDRVSLTFGDASRLEMAAIHPPVEIKHETALLHRIKEAMFEAIDQGAVLAYPPRNPAAGPLLTSQQSLAETVGTASLSSLPLTVNEKIVGALVLERHRQHPFSPQELGLLDQSGRLLAPLLQLRQQAEQPLVRLFSQRLGRQLRSWLGSGGLWLKLGLPLLALLLLAAGLIEGDYRIEARANLEGRIQRVVTAPFDGYLQEVSAKAGDVVSQGAPLCQLDDRDLQLEQAKWQTELAKLQRERREALAGHERSRVRILQAQSEQLQAELELVEMKLARSRVTAPLHGVIVSGDLSQSLGAPLKRGEELFKIAPLESYRIMLQVDERDIGAVEVGQSGSLRLAGYPHLEQHFTVKRILPLSVAEEGSYLFTLEAELAEASQQTDHQLRPGLQGVAKIDAGRRSLLWLAGHRLADWLRLQLWRWWP